MKKNISWFLLVFIFIFLDQWLKIWVKTHMILGEQFPVIGNWFYIHFLENSGAAFGIYIDQPWFKPTLSIFRLIIITLIGWYFLRILRDKKTPRGIKFCFSLILAGAIGNILDSIFYGVIFTESYMRTADFLPVKGYAPILYGKVVDMFYFPLINTTFPEWIPFLGGKNFEFFRPVFNLADSYISVSIFVIIIFFRNWFSTKKTVLKNKPEINKNNLLHSILNK